MHVSLPKCKHFDAVMGRLWQSGSCFCTTEMLCAICHSSLQKTVLTSIHWLKLGWCVIPFPSQRGKRYKHMKGTREDLHIFEAPSRGRPLMMSWDILSLESWSTFVAIVTLEPLRCVPDRQALMSLSVWKHVDLSEASTTFLIRLLCLKNGHTWID